MYNNFFRFFFKNNLSSLPKPSLHICHGENEGRQWESAEVGPSLPPATTALCSSGCRPPTNPPSALAADCEQWLVLAVALMIIIVFRLWSWSLLLAMPGYRERHTWVLKTRQIEKKYPSFLLMPFRKLQDDSILVSKMAFSSLSVQALPVPETKI